MKVSPAGRRADSGFLEVREPFSFQGHQNGMTRKSIGLLAAAALTFAACGGGDGVGLPDPEAPMLQVRSEGGFVPVEFNLGRGPTYTLMADGRLIYEGPVILIYPGPLLPNYQVTQLADAKMDEIRALVDEIGLPGMQSEIDDSAASTVADASTEVVTYWDEAGEHRYSVYALGIDPNPSNPATAATADLIQALSEASFSGESAEYVGDRTRVIAGVAQTAPDPELEDIRPWPLEDEDPAGWAEVGLGFTCRVLGSDAVEAFRDATQATQWLHPDTSTDAPPFTLLVRSLHPGEPDCPET
jgi:hypothetical protein